MSKERSSYWAVAYLLTAPIQIYLWGFTFATMWGWFLVDAIRVDPIGVWHAMGVIMTIRFATIDWDKKQNQFSDENKTDFKDKILVSFLTPVVFLGVGWVIKYFM